MRSRAWYERSAVRPRSRGTTPSVTVVRARGGSTARASFTSIASRSAGASTIATRRSCGVRFAIA